MSEENDFFSLQNNSRDLPGPVKNPHAQIDSAPKKI